MSESSPVQVELTTVPCRRGHLGMVNLTHPKALNSLTLNMVRSIAIQLGEWQQDPEIAAVVIHSDSERAFCAGGDVKTVALKQLREPADSYPADFFTWEYKMDYAIRVFPKPILAWGDGIVMGGGLGVFRGSSHRVVTERSVLAMPEITIGFFPDVGGGLFLNELPEGVGLFLGWTGARLAPADAIHLGLAQYQLEARRKREFFDRLAQMEWTLSAADDSAALSELLSHASQKISAPLLVRFEDRIQRAFTEATPAAVREAFFKIEEGDPWWVASRSAFAAGSPTSAHVIMEHLGRSRGRSALDVFVAEWSLARRFLEKPDFTEGVRALLIDKDGRPGWQPNRFEDVRAIDVDAHFEPYSGEIDIRTFFASPRAYEAST